MWYSGVDAVKFLQGQCTNDILLLKSHGDILPAAFLTPKGRILTDTLIYLNTDSKTASKTEYLIETHRNASESFKAMLMQYRLRAKVAIESRDYMVEVRAAEGQANDCVVEGVDPRLVTKQKRAIIKKPSVIPSSADQHLLRYTALITLQGIAEGSSLVNRIPLECNLDLLGYICFKKGCYVGQELTARTKFKGLVRKRLVPFYVMDKVDRGVNRDFEPLTSDALEQLHGVATTSSGGSLNLKAGCKVMIHGEEESSQSDVGEVVYVHPSGAVGIAMMNLDSILSNNKSSTFSVTKATLAIEGGDQADEGSSANKNKVESICSIVPFRPSWFSGLDEKTNLTMDKL